MTTELAVPISALARRDELGVEDVIAQVQKIQGIMEKVMKEGEHFGVIPGTQKPTLLKPGAEKLLLTFRFDPQYESTETYDGKHLTVKSKCTLWHITSGQRMGSGEGSCSTKESKYAYREQKRTCPRCGMETIFRSKYPPKSNPQSEPGWYCFAKRGGCGFEYAVDDPKITNQKIGRVPNEDLADQYNTVLKMANKRSLVAAVLNVTAASDIFTQDLEDNHVTGETGTSERGETNVPAHGSPTRTPRAAGASPVIESEAPTDPDAPELKREAENLFPTPAAVQERDALLLRINKHTTAKITVVQRRINLGDGDYRKLDLAALKTLAEHLEASKQ